MKALILMCLLMIVGLYACSTEDNARVEDPMVARAQAVLDSGMVLKEMMMTRYDSSKVVDELDALKILNNVQMAASNMEDLEALLTQYKQLEASDPEREDLIIQIETQREYLEALLASSQAILNNNSLSFGKWSSQPATSDSSLNIISMPDSQKK
jgi:hypothetical protein